MVSKATELVVNCGSRGLGGQFKSGHEKLGGRKKGTQNKFTTLKQAFLDAFISIGGKEGLAEWARNAKNRKDFYVMISKMLPREVSLEGLSAPVTPSNLEGLTDDELDLLIERDISVIKKQKGDRN